MAVRLSGNCDVAGRVRDKKHTETMVGEHKSARERAGSLTMSEADRLCENEKKKRREMEVFQTMAREEIQLGTHCVRVGEGSQLVTHVSNAPRYAPNVQMPLT